jgi:hypothetical protein
MAMRRGKFVIFYGNTKGIRLSNATFAENSAAGTAIGTLSVVGGVGTYTFTLTDDAGGKVQVAGVNGVNLQAGATPSAAGSFTIIVHADNGAGSIFDQTFVITAVSAAAELLADTGQPILADTGQPILVQ